jgi:type 1 glutamine amidotransferase
MPGLNVLIKCLGRTSGLQVVLIRADDPWEQGPEQILGADCVVLYLAEGAKWIAQDAARMAAFQELRARGGGLVCLHWAMGTRDAEYIEPFLTLFGGCHGGPDRKYKVVSVRATPTEQAHPVLGGIGPFDVHDEFYYALKFVKPAQRITPLISVPIDGSDYPVAWAFERKEGGRSFGFSGGHFHKNWKLPEYRRLAVQAVLWTLNLPIPEEGVSVEVSENDLKLFPRE